MDKNKIVEDVSKYYSEKLQTFGATPKGVDWNSVESQETRFNQLSSIINSPGQEFSILDYGCGYGSMYAYLKNKFSENFSFHGYDISEEMTSKAKEIYGNDSSTEWFTQIDPSSTKVDYVIASGIFNVRLNHSNQDWQAYILDTLQQFNSLATKGFAFNMLTSYSDKEYMRDYLYYAEPFFFFDYCKKNFSKYVAVLHDYPLYEFTILVKKL